MNEKLKQIAIKAQVEHCVSHVRLKEFADLIVRECANIADNADVDMLRVGNAIKQHFGIEETPKLGPGVNYRPTYPDQE